MQLSISKHKFFGFIGRIFLSYIIFISLTIIFNQNNSDRFSSFLIVLFSAIVSLFYLSKGYYSKYGFNVFGYLIFALIFKLFIGFLFWEFYLFPDYFSNSSSQFYFDHYEYLITYERLQELAEYRISNGFLSFPIVELVDKYILIRYVMSGIFLSGSFHAFDLAVQNSLFSIYTALIISQIVSNEGGSSKQVKIALLITVFQPLSFISTMIWREIVGQFFVALGGYFLYVSTKKNKIFMLFLILLATLSFFVNRYAYAFFPIIVIFGYFFFSSKNKYGLLILPFVYIFISYFDNMLSITTHLSESYGSNFSSLSFWFFLPINLLKLFLGPFPWTNWFEFNDNSIFLIGQYFQSVMNISLVVLTFKIILYNKVLKKSKSLFKSIKPIESFFLILVSLFVFAGFGTEEIHVNYMASGIVFLIPVISLSKTKISFMKVFFSVLYFFLVLNIIFVSFGLTGEGFGSSFT